VSRSDELDARMREALKALEEAADPATYARIVQRERILLGTATWKERLRWRLGLGPTAERIRGAETVFKFRQATRR
jgi:hypothetical protein